MAEDLPFTTADLEALRQWDTPTICNALELVVPARRGRGFSIRPFVCAHPSLPPICGLARTGTIRAAQPSGRTREDDRAARLGWYEYVANSPLPTVVVIEDLDEVPGTGAFWGEVNSAVHKALGAQGVVTSGSIRDLDMAAPGFQMLAGSVGPSHAYVHVVDFGGEVNIAGMVARHNDLIHADRHGAVVVPHDAVEDVLKAADLVTRKEAPILACARGADFSLDALEAAFGQSDDVH